MSQNFLYCVVKLQLQFRNNVEAHHETVKQQERNGCATMLLQLSNCSVTIVQLLQWKRTQYNSETFMQQSWSIKEEEEIKKNVTFFSVFSHEITLLYWSSSSFQSCFW